MQPAAHSVLQHCITSPLKQRLLQLQLKDTKMRGIKMAAGLFYLLTCLAAARYRVITPAESRATA